MFCVLLLLMIHFGLLAEIVNVKTTSLYGELNEEIYVGCPPGMKGLGEINFIILGKCICGLV